MQTHPLAPKSLFCNRLAGLGSLFLFFAGPVMAAEPFPLVAEDPSSPILSFEGDALPGSLQPDKGSTVALSKRHFINGSRSLKWSWEGPAELYFDRSIPYKTDGEAFKVLKRGAVSVFSFWVYNEKALPGETLRVEFGAKNCWFDFGLDFTGWRTCSVAFSRDMDGSPEKGMRGLRIKAPASVPAGEVFIDRIILSSVDDKRYQWPDKQVPFVKGHSYATMKITPLPDVAVDLPEERAAVETVETLFEKEYLLETPASSEEVKAIRNACDEFNIVMEDGVVRGPHVLFSRNALRDRQDSVYPRKLNEQDTYLMSQYAELRTYTDLMQRIALAYRSLPATDPQAVRLRETFILMSRHLLDQGWQENSSLYTTHHFGYASRGWYVAVFLMRDELAKENLLDPVTRSLIWYMREKVDFAKMEFNPSKGTDLDYMNTVCKPHLMMVLSLPDSPVKTALVKKFGSYFSDLLAADTQGTLGGIKADGSAFHHGGNYPGYSFPAYRSSATLCRLLNGTPFAIRENGLKNLNKALTAAAIYCNPDLGLALGGRHPFSPSSITALQPALDDLETCGHPLELDLQNMPDGHWSFNYGCFGIHRWNGKMVTLKGFSKYVWSSEIYTRDNRYGRYQSHGSVQIMNKEGRAASGLVEEGWDWNRLPGTTTIHRPLDELESPKKNTLMFRSDVQFTGSSHLQGRYGLFGVELKESDLENFDPAFTARKSMFCFDNRIVCLGAGISSKTAKRSTETTLFQHAWSKDSKVWMNSPEPLAACPSEKSGGGKSWLVDNHGNGYYVASGGEVKLAVSKQDSRHNKTKEPTSGTFAAAWIDHGAAPKNASYEYAILLDGTPEKMTAFATRPPYKVIRNDPQAQIVYDRAAKVIGYALFESYTGPANSLLSSTDRPCFVMIKPGAKTMALSIGNGDLRIPGADGSYTTDEPSRPGYADIVINGEWKLAEETTGAEVKAANGRTSISVDIEHAIPVQLKLTSVK